MALLVGFGVLQHTMRKTSFKTRNISNLNNFYKTIKRQLGFECSEVPFYKWSIFEMVESQILGGKRGKKENVFKEYLFLFLSFFFLFLLRSGSGTSRKVASALNSRADVTSLLITVPMCFLGSLLSSLTRFTENPSIYLSPPAPNSSLQNSAHFGGPLPIGYFNFYYFSFFLIFNRMGAWSRCVATRLYILYVAADELIFGWEFYC